MPEIELLREMSTELEGYFASPQLQQTVSSQVKHNILKVENKIIDFVVVRLKQKKFV